MFQAHSAKLWHVGQGAEDGVEVHRSAIQLKLLQVLQVGGKGVELNQELDHLMLPINVGDGQSLEARGSGVKGGLESLDCGAIDVKELSVNSQDLDRFSRGQEDVDHTIKRGRTCPRKRL